MKRLLLLNLVALVMILSSGIAYATDSYFQTTLKGALSGDAEAQFNLGSIFYNGTHNKSQNLKEAAYWITRSAEQDHAEAQHLLGIMYLVGEGVHQDPSQGIKWITKAAENGHSGAQMELGHTYCRGEFVKKNYTEAARWYTKAIMQDNVVALNNLGLMYRDGAGVPQNYIKAYVLWSVAAAQNDQASKENLEKVIKMMTPAQIAEGQKRAEILWNIVEKYQ